MTKEIKKILDDIKIVSNGECARVCFDDEQCDLLLNYITNLQKENEKLKEIINDDMTVYLKGLEDGKDKMKEIFESVYKSRNEKAVENLKRFDIEYLHETYQHDLANEIEFLLNILQGGDE